MIKISNVGTFNLEGALRGMRNPLESHSKSDSKYIYDPHEQDFNYMIGKQDLALASRLANAGSDHGKFLRQIFVSLDITAPLYWWKEFDTYKIGTVANSTSTMHRLGSRDLTDKDFSWDSLSKFQLNYLKYINELIHIWREDKSETNFRNMIQNLMDNYNQTRTITLNYAVLRNQYVARKNHKLLEWRSFCEWIKTLPYAEELIITK